MSADLEELVPTDPEVEAFLAEVAQEGAELVADLAYEPTPRDRVAERARLAQRLAREETGDWIPERSSMPEPAEFDP